MALSLLNSKDPKNNSKIFTSIVAMLLVVVVVLFKIFKDVEIPEYYVWALVTIVLGSSGLSQIKHSE